MKQTAAEPQSTPAVQRALQVSQPGDRWEREADEMSDEVMRMPDTALSDTRGWRLVQRCPDGSCGTDDEGEVMRSVTSGSSSKAPGLDSSALIGRLVGGRPLTSGERSFFEPRFNRDFSSVRIHDTREAAGAAKSIHALAFTRGHAIGLAVNSYQPGSHSGRRLLAHELSHVIQQGAAAEFVEGSQ